MKTKYLFILTALAAAVFLYWMFGTQARPNQSGKAVGYETFFDLHVTDQDEVRKVVKKIKSNWHPGNVVMLVEMFQLVKYHKTKKQVGDLLNEMTGEEFGIDGKAWLNWVWNRDFTPHPEYAEFKSKLYAHVDERFVEYYHETGDAKIRLDEIRWGGVKQDQIPPLSNPPSISASEADYLGDSNVVFGVSINGEHRCYPKRILAWHEMFKDIIGGVSVCGVY